MTARRKTLIAIWAGALLPDWSSHVQHKGAPRRVGYLFSFTPAEGQHLWDACRQGMRELGYVEGRDVVLEPRRTDGRHERLPDLVAELVRLKGDVMPTR